MATRFDFQNVQIQRGNKETFTVTVNNNGAVQSLAGYSIKMMIRPRPESYIILADSTIDAGMTIADGSNGSVYSSGIVGCVISAAISQSLPNISYAEVQAVSGGTLAPITLAVVKLICSEEVLR